MDAIAQTPVVDLTDETLTKLAQNPVIITAFPFIGTMIARANAVRTVGRCGHPCGRGARRRTTSFNGMRRAIAELPMPQKAKLKTLLNTHQVIVRYTQANGRTQKLRF